MVCNIYILLNCSDQLGLSIWICLLNDDLIVGGQPIHLMNTQILRRNGFVRNPRLFWNKNLMSELTAAVTKVTVMSKKNPWAEYQAHVFQERSKTLAIRN